MSKAARNRQNRDAGDARPRTGAPASSVFPNFPYERKFTTEEIHGDILPRAKRMGDLMRDGQGPNGAILFIPGDMFELWMIHGVLAGADGGKPYIRSRRLPDQAGRLVDAVEWVVLKEDTPEQRAADDEAEAAAYIDAIDTKLRPEVAAAIRRRFAEAGRAAAEELADDADADTLRDKPRDFGPPLLVELRDDEPNDPEETTT